MAGLRQESLQVGGVVKSMKEIGASLTFDQIPPPASTAAYSPCMLMQASSSPRSIHLEFAKTPMYFWHFQTLTAECVYKC